MASGCGSQRSACSPSTPTFRVRILPKPTVFSVKFVFENNENKQKKLKKEIHGIAMIGNRVQKNYKTMTQQFCFQNKQPPFCSLFKTKKNAYSLSMNKLVFWFYNLSHIHGSLDLATPSILWTRVQIPSTLSFSQQSVH